MAIDFFSGLMQGLGQSIQQSRDNAARDKLLKAQVRLFEEQLKAREREAQREELQTAARGEVAQLTAQRKPGEELMSVLSPEMLGEAVRLGGIDQAGIQGFGQIAQQERQQQAQTQFISGLPQQQQLAAQAGGIEPFVQAQAPLSRAQQAEIDIRRQGLQQEQSQFAQTQQFQRQRLEFEQGIERQRLAILSRGMDIDEEKSRMQIAKTAKQKGHPDAVIAKNEADASQEIAVLNEAESRINVFSDQVDKFDKRGLLEDLGKGVATLRGDPFGFNAELDTAYQAVIGALAKFIGTGALQINDERFVKEMVSNPTSFFTSAGKTKVQIKQLKEIIGRTRVDQVETRRDFMRDSFADSLLKKPSKQQAKPTGRARAEDFFTE